jgi:hypothetical protein
MFKNLLRELDTLKNTTSIGVPIEADSEGYYDKECPAENCLFGFKVHGDDWKNLVRDEEVFCPAGRHSAPSKSWYTRDQIEHAKEYALKQLQGGINSAMRQDASDWNRRQPRNAFIKMTMDVRGVSTPVLMPVAAAEPMRLRTAARAADAAIHTSVQHSSALPAGRIPRITPSSRRSAPCARRRGPAMCCANHWTPIKRKC